MGRRKAARSQKDKDKDYISEMEMCEPQDEDYDDEEINQHTANILKRSNEGHEENADRVKTGNLKIVTANGSDNAIFRREISTPINGTVKTALEELDNSSRATERLKTRTPLEEEGQQLLHERFVSRCNEDIRARPLMNAHSHMEGNDRQRTSEHNGPDKDIFRRPERYIENMHYQNTRFQDFQDCSGQGDRVSNRKQTDKEVQNSGQQTHTDKRTCMLHQGKK
ncbi:unnamed protein product [Mytilus edulis]|uniref:Uncharacterized protein n=1 Tax=Mytilus edulis TaxID=6550 RepID=A0A8S3Q6E8_MYTED|nr:unnamed protein product [Mytilus edulis]